MSILFEAYDRLWERFGPQGWWPADSPFEVAVGAILTQNTAWRNVELALDNLREAEVLSAMADGLTKKEVADQLKLSYHTIDLYTRNIYEKLKAPNNAAAIATAIRKGLI